VASVRHSFARLFAYGLLSVILVFYLIGLGLAEAQSGLVLTLTLAGDVVVSLLLTTQADRIGRRRMLNRPVCTKRKLPSAREGTICDRAACSVERKGPTSLSLGLMTPIEPARIKKNRFRVDANATPAAAMTMSLMITRT
jgi:hypothetical protein